MPLPSTILYPSGGGGGGAGDVVGPASSTDNAIARYDGITGKLLQDSAVTIADTTGSITMTSTGQYLWSTDTGLARSAAGVVKVTDGSTGYGKLLVSGSLAAMAFGGQTGSDPAIGESSSTAGRLAVTDGGGAGYIPIEASRFYVGASGSYFTASGTTAYVGADNGLTITNAAGSTIQALRASRTVEASTAGSGAPNVLTAPESMNVLTNEGSTATNYHTLPTAVAGYVFTFCVQDADGLRVTASASDTIRVIDKVTAAAGYIESTTIGSTVTLEAINATEWFATSIKGVWTDGTWSYDDTSLTSP